MGTDGKGGELEFGDDGAAWDVLRVHFWDNRGLITKRDPAYQPTKQEYEAIHYLFLEWDYGYEEPAPIQAVEPDDNLPM